MKKNYSAKKVLQVSMLFFMIITTNMFAQVGIGTITPHGSSVLDVSSTTQGMLAPRMTTAQKIAIVSPANGLMVYDTDLKLFSYYDLTATTWVNSAQGRSKFKRIKSTDVLATVLASEKAAGGDAKYLLDSQTLYEINGTVNLDLPIELNNAYVIGLDSSDDKLVKATGDLFVGTTGGSIRVLTLVASAGNVFNIIGTGSIGAGTQTQNLILRDGIIVGSSSVGKIENFALVFISIIQYAGNATGIVYKDISKLLINNAGWFGNNSGTYETLQGTFGLVGKIGGFTEVVGNNTGFSVSSNPVITNDAVLREVIFTGAITSGKFINGYTTGSYSGFNFDNKWAVNCPGIPVESDLVSTGDVNFDYAVGSGASTTFSGSTKTKLLGTTTSNNLFRFSTDVTNNRLKYLGNKKRYFTVRGSLSFQSSASTTTYIVYIAKNGTVVNQSKVYINSTTTNDILAIPIGTTLELSPTDYIEVFAERYSGSGNMLTVSLNLSIN
ncbi:hypothetical protein [uncultured Flavobacterium sp.]|uniref:hypothetical protein n=1 Tax=uncultured Flavobacterium sp. TaxID=165435 RepID=UPI0030EC0CA7